MYTSLLPQTVEVYRRSGRIDRFGQPVDENPRAGNAEDLLVATYPCRCYQKSGGLQMTERSRDTFVKYYELFTSLDADIHEDDAVRVLGQGGVEILSRSKVASGEIVYDAAGPHHQEFLIYTMDGPK